MRDRPGYAAFRSRDFRLFSASRLLSIMALQMQNVAVGWLVYDLTRSASSGLPPSSRRSRSCSSPATSRTLSTAA